MLNIHENEVVGYRQTLKVARERNISEAVAELEALAPYKKLIWFENSAHGVPGEEPENFFQALVNEVLPLTKR